jgi:hypothetical protein
MPSSPGNQHPDADSDLREAGQIDECERCRKHGWHNLNIQLRHDEKGKRTNKPEFTSWSLVYDKRSATFYRNKISLSTVNGRIEVDFELPADSPTPYEEYGDS